MSKRHDALPGDGSGDSTMIISGHATLRQWRRIALERQLPRVRFPGGISVPSVITMVCLLVIGGCTVGYFLRPPSRSVPAAVRESQRDLVSEVAHRISVGTRRDHDAIVAIAAGQPGPDPSTLVQAAAAGEPSWRSVEIWDPVSGSVAATAGEPLPAQLLTAANDPDALVSYVGADGRGRVLHVVQLADGKMLGVSTMLGIRTLRLNPADAQSVLFVLNGDTLIYSQGSPVAAADPVRAVIARAGAARAVHTSFGHDVTRAGHQRVPVASAAPVDGTGYAVVSLIYAQRTGAGTSTSAALLGGALLLIALLSFGWTRLAFVRPVRRLLADAVSVACGELGGASRASHLREAHRIGGSLEALAPWHSTPRSHPRRFTLGATTVVSVTALAIVGWSIGVFTVVRDASVIPTQLVADYQNHVDDAANAMRDMLDTGLAKLTAEATREAGAPAGARPERSLASLLHDNPRFRSVYLMDAAGHVGAQAGRPPLLRNTSPGGAAGLLLDPHSTKVPLIVAHVPLRTGQLVAEFDISTLRSVLTRVDGDVQVVDHQLRSIIDTGGFIAFHEIHNSDARSVAGAAVSAAGAGPLPSGQHQITVASVVGDEPTGADAAAGTAAVASPSDALGWVVVVSRPVADLALPNTRSMHVAWLLMLLASMVAVGGWAWQYTIFVRPLATLAGTAEQVTRGEHPAPIAPERFDEVGSLAICLEVCRQSRKDGQQRLAGAARLRGAGDDYTVVLPKIKA